MSLRRLMFYNAALLMISLRTAEGYGSSYALMNVKEYNACVDVTVCVNYQQWKDKKLAASVEDAEVVKFGWWGGSSGNTNLCLPETRNVSGHVIIGNYRLNAKDLHTCPDQLNASRYYDLWTTFQAAQVKARGGSNLLLLVEGGKKYMQDFDDYLFSGFSAYPFNESLNDVNVFFVYIKTFGTKLPWVVNLVEYEVRFYRPVHPAFDWAMLLLFLSAMICVTVGGKWSGYKRMTMWKSDSAPLHGVLNYASSERPIGAADGSNEDVDDTGHASEDQTARGHEETKSKSRATLITIVVSLVVVVATLLLLYYFHDVLVWFMIVVFVVLCTFTMYCCMSAAVSAANCCQRRCCIGCHLLPCGQCNTPPKVIDILLFLVAATVSIFWCLARKCPYAFILQDVMAMSFCIHVIKTVRIPNLKWLTIGLGALLVYDLFMVFVTPYFTTDGCSVMVKVATGGAGCPSADGTGHYPAPPQWHETIPIMLKFPLLSDPMPCHDMDVDLEYPSAILGLGDIALPGLLIGYCFAVDYIYGTWFWYGTAALFGYAVGLTATFVSLMWMESAQPALIYLLPCTWIPVLLTAIIKKQVCMLWKGDMPKPRADVEYASSEDDERINPKGIN